MTDQTVERLTQVFTEAFERNLTIEEMAEYCDTNCVGFVADARREALDGADDDDITRIDGNDLTADDYLYLVGGLTRHRTIGTRQDLGVLLAEWLNALESKVYARKVFPDADTEGADR